MRISPSSRLVLWSAILPIAGVLWAAEPSWAAAGAAVAGAFVLTAMIDAGLSKGRLGQLKLEFPEIVRTSKDRPVRLEFRIFNPGITSTLRLALPVAKQIETAEEDLVLNLPEKSEWSAAAFQVTARARGRYRINAIAMEIPSPLGFWRLRGEQPIRCELRVYPNLYTERHSLAGILLRRGSVGIHSQRQIGKGREFEKLREYLPGDSYDEIHWKATARRGHPITKVFQIERTQEIYLVIDTSRLSAQEVAPNETLVDVDGTQTTTLDRYLTAALVLAQAAEQQGDLFGLIAFSDKIEKYVRAGSGKAHYAACRDALYLLQPRPVSPDFDEVTVLLRTRLRRRALVIFLTSLDDSTLAESFLRNADLLRKEHLVLVNMIQPQAVAPIFSGPPASQLDDVYQHLGGHLLWHNLHQLQGELRNRGVHFGVLRNERLCPELLSQYLGIKQRQAL